MRASERGMPVAILTGTVLVVDRVEASGFPYMLKPFRVDELMKMIREAVSTNRRSE
jgi:DNA-binding response OmpR family regulator